MTPSPSPRLLRVEALMDGHPVPSAWFEATLEPYHLLFGPSDDRGLLTIDWEEVVTQANRELEFAVMDRWPPVAQLSGLLRVRVLGPRDIARIVDADARWQRLPATTMAGVQQWGQKLRAWVGRSVTVSVVVEPPHSFITCGQPTVI